MATRRKHEETSAQEWRRRLDEKRRGLAVPLLLPSGMTVKLVRPGIETWFGTAKLPEYVSKTVSKVFGGGTVTDMEEQVKHLTEEEAAGLVTFLNRLVVEAIVDPKVVDKDPADCADDEFALADMDEADKAAIQLAVMDGVPTQPVPTFAGREVSMAAIEKFRDVGRGAPAGEGGGEVRDAP